MNALQERFKKELLSSLRPSTSPSAAATDRSSTQREERRRHEERSILEDDDPLRVPNRRPPRNEPPEW